jgi:hypothetical protein
MAILEKLSLNRKENISHKNSQICYVPFTHLINRSCQIEIHTHVLLFNLQKDKDNNYTFYDINYPANKLEYCKLIYLQNIAEFFQSKRVKINLIKNANQITNIEISSLKELTSQKNLVTRNFHKDNFFGNSKIVNPYINNTLLYQTYKKNNDVNLLHNIARKEKYNYLNTPIENLSLLSSYSLDNINNLKKVHSKIITNNANKDFSLDKSSSKDHDKNPLQDLLKSLESFEDINKILKTTTLQEKEKTNNLNFNQLKNKDYLSNSYQREI